MATAIEFNHVGKQYRLGLVSTGTISHDLNRWWQTSILGKEDPYLKIGSVNDRTQKADSDYVWALRDIDFKVEQGDVVGIIGKNGAGKSTLLKLLSKVTGPTVGSIRARGRIASLLEVGTGFHGEMTGRENIYLNGAILGMTKREISAKLDEIVDFSGCERYLDTPVKRYSSGMTVRMGFAVAAFLDPEILVVDEVLAVGDAEFQKKAIGKMQDVSKSEGRTVLFVSHNMGSIKMLCTRGVLLDQGLVKLDGNVDEVVDAYLSNQLDIRTIDRSGSADVQFVSYKIINDHVSLSDDIKISLSIQINKQYYSKLLLSLDFYDSSNNRIAHVLSSDDGLNIECSLNGVVDIDCVVKNINLTPGKYTISIWAGTMLERFDYIEHCMTIYVEQGRNLILREVTYPTLCPMVLGSNWNIR